MSVFKSGDKYTWNNTSYALVPYGENRITVVQPEGSGYIIELEGKPFNLYGGYYVSESELLQMANVDIVYRVNPSRASLQTAAARVHDAEDACDSYKARHAYEQIEDARIIMHAALIDFWEAFKRVESDILKGSE